MFTRPFNFFARWSFARQMAVIVLAIALPLNLGVVLALHGLASATDAKQRESLLFTARSMVAAVDAELGKYLLLGRALAASPNLLSEDLAAFEVEARRAFQGIKDAWVVVADRDGQQLMNIRARPGQPLPKRVTQGIASQREAASKMQPVVSNVTIGPVSKEWVVTIDFPVLRDGEHFRALAITIRCARFLEISNVPRTPENWLTGVIDREGRFIARYPDYETRAGTLASEGWRQSRDIEGISEFKSLEGDGVINANLNSRISGWSVAVAVKESELQDATWAAMGLSITFGGALSILSLVFAIFLANRLASAIGDVRENAVTLLERGETPYEPELPDLQELWDTLKSAVNGRRAIDERLRLVMQEVNHRSKNLLSLIQAIARQTASTSPENFLPRFQERLQALSANQDLLVKSQWKGIDFEALVRSQLAYCADLIDKRILLEGPALNVTPTAAQSLSMAIHELCTNAIKYGALSVPDGKVRIVWSLSKTGQDFTLSWVERGGPPAMAPSQAGFGTVVLTRLVRLSLSAAVTLDYDEAGVTWTLQCPAAHVQEKAAKLTESVPPGPSADGTMRVLVVEDEPLIAMEILNELENNGFRVVGPASTVDQALEFLDRQGCDIAVLDVNLGSETSEPVAATLIERRTPFITVSGYSEDQRPAIFKNAPTLSKPVAYGQITAQLTRLLGAPWAQVKGARA